MFSSFLFFLREKGLSISLHEWLTLMEALDKGLSNASLTGFYYLCRGILIKSEADFDKFDRVFIEYFKNVASSLGLAKELLEWLENPKEKAEEPLDIERAEKNKGLSYQEIQKMFLERIQQQKQEHSGGSYWIGTGGVSVFGNGGFSPQGIRVGGESHYKNALQVASDRKFRDLRNDTTLDTRQFQVAFRSLREFSSHANQSKKELDIDQTIDSTCKNGGQLQTVFTRPRKNTIKVLLLMDSGGSMDYHSQLCSTLFQAVSKSTHFSDLKRFYFHNCIYSHVFTESTLQVKNAVETTWLLKNISRDYKVIIVGDARMHPSELLEESYYIHSCRDKTAGLTWLKQLKANFKNIIWLNPATRPAQAYYSSATYDIIKEMFDMYPLTVKDLNKALKKMLVRVG